MLSSASTKNVWLSNDGYHADIKWALVGKGGKGGNKTKIHSRTEETSEMRKEEEKSKFLFGIGM